MAKATQRRNERLYRIVAVPYTTKDIPAFSGRVQYVRVKRNDPEAAYRPNKFPCKFCQKDMLVAPGSFANYHGACRKLARHRKKT